MKKSELKLKIYDQMQESNIAIDQDLFDYGYEIMNQYILFVFFSVIICVFMGTFRELLLFYLVFIPIRKNIGGFHFTSRKLCFVFSILVSLMTAFFMRESIFDLVFLIFIGLILCMLTFIFGCIDNSNKLLTDEEKKFYKKRGLILEMIFILFGYYFYLKGWYLITNAICLVFSFFCFNYLICIKSIN